MTDFAWGRKLHCMDIEDPSATRFAQRSIVTSDGRSLQVSLRHGAIDGLLLVELWIRPIGCALDLAVRCDGGETRFFADVREDAVALLLPAKRATVRGVSTLTLSAVGSDASRSESHITIEAVRVTRIAEPPGHDH